LTIAEFNAACDRCRREGLPLTMENIDPEFWRWYRASRWMVVIRFVLLIVAVAFVAWMICT
jgi:hypothetical protein